MGTNTVAYHPSSDSSLCLQGGEATPGAEKTYAAELTSFLAPPQGPDEIGRLGGYRILNILGAGAMGVVFHAEDLQLRRSVALKALQPTLALSEAARTRFLREAQAAAALDHDNIVHIYQVGEDRGTPFLAMQFLRGESLSDRLKRERPLPLAETLRIGREVAEGLAAAHEQGLIHRDIKPGNIWLEKKEEGGKRSPSDSSFNLSPSSFKRAKILDFGLARPIGDSPSHLTHHGVIVGTPGYMAPEQAQGKKVDARADLFSLGVTLYLLCTGERPFRGPDVMSTLLALATHHPPPPSARNAGIPQALSDLVMQLLAKDPNQRPAFARDVVAAIQAIELALPASDPVPTPLIPDGPGSAPSDAEIFAISIVTEPISPPNKPFDWQLWLFFLVAGCAVLALGVVGYFVFSALFHGGGANAGR
jgi:eukaryotic-like serine/threonine-protein kinase